MVTAHTFVTRRLLLKDMGKAGLAIMILGAAACSSESEPGSSTTGAGDTSSNSSSIPTTTTDTSTETEPPMAESHQWHRVNLGFVSAYILYRSGEATIVDTGVDGSALSIESGLEEVGLGWSDVSGLILTHHHPDHQGSVQGVLASSPTDTPWYAGSADLGSIAAPTEGTAVGDNDRVNGLQVIETPGHTAGHISILDSESGILVTGDALNGDNGGVVGANPGFSEDMDMANASVAKLAGFDFEVALFGHGEPIFDGASTAVAHLAETLE